MFVLSEPAYPRRKVERGFKQLYNIGLALNFGAFVITMTSFTGRMSTTYDTFFSRGDLKLAPGLTALLQDCPATPRHFGMNGLTTTSALDIMSCPFVFMTTTNLILGILIVHALLIAFDFLAKLCFSMNIRHLRFRGLHIPLSATLVLGVWSMSITVITLVGASQATRDFIQDFVDECAKNYQVNNQALFVQTENDAEVVFGTSFVLILISTCLNLFAYFCATVTYLNDAYRKENAVLLREQFPWEKGCLCRPDKAKLKAWCRWRREQEEAVKENLPRSANPVLEALAYADEAEVEEKSRMLSEQLAANEQSRQRQRPPTAIQPRSAPLPVVHERHQQQHQQQQAYQHGPQRGGKEVPALWDQDGEMFDDGEGFIGDGLTPEDEYGGVDGVGADYVYEQSRRKHRRRRHHRDEEPRDDEPRELERREGGGRSRRHRSRRESRMDEDEAAQDMPRDGGREYAAVSMPSIDGS
jgi:hypothetical protein